MIAWKIRRPGPIDSGPLDLVESDVPEPGPHEVLVRVLACGVCRTDLHLAEGDLRPIRDDVIPGHEVVGTVDALGAGASRFPAGKRVGIAWLGHTCGHCRFCRAGRENLCLQPRFTGWDLDGGYAQFVVAHEDYVYDLPEQFDDERVAPLLCAGIIGYRALRMSELPPGGSLGIYGFGGSAHLTCQVAIAQGARVHVFTRSRAAQELALSLGASTANSPKDSPAEPMDAAILFAPAGELVGIALKGLDRGGTLAIAGIHLSPFGPLDLSQHLYYERRLVSVTANTRKDGEEFLRIADRIGIQVSTQTFALEEADLALSALAHGRITGAAVLRP